jgi:hypothetical protein
LQLLSEAAVMAPEPFASVGALFRSLGLGLLGIGAYIFCRGCDGFDHWDRARRNRLDRAQRLINEYRDLRGGPDKG